MVVFSNTDGEYAFAGSVPCSRPAPPLHQHAVTVIEESQAGSGFNPQKPFLKIVY